MTYKESISIFRTELKIRCQMKDIPVPKLSDKEIMVMLSKAQNHIQSSYKVTHDVKQVGYVEGENTYNLSDDLGALVI